MLRRRPDSTFEFRLVEAAITAAAPAPLTPERRDALHLRIFSNLGPQDSSRRLLPVAPGFVRERWVAIPAGVGIAAAIFAANRVVLDQSPSASTGSVAVASGEIVVDGRTAASAVPGQRIEARSPSWVSLGGVQVGLEPGAVVQFSGSGDGLSLRVETGDVTVVTGERGLSVSGNGWAAVLQAATVARFVPMGDAMVVHVADGAVQLDFRGRSYTITPATSPFLLPGLSDEPGDASTTGAGQEPLLTPIDAGGAGGSGHGVAAHDGSPDLDSPPSDPPGHGGDNPGNGSPPSDPPGQGGENPRNGSAPSNPPGQGGDNPGNGSPPSDPPGHGGENPGNGSPPSDPPGHGGDNPGNGSPPSDPPGHGG
ncbi:MAG: hypothetical protein KJ053_02760, partial [Dehalococcoidia bacterium]|nr:hypothetical protein [Dehalococcoidia bacterium]